MDHNPNHIHNTGMQSPESLPPMRRQSPQPLREIDPVGDIKMAPFQPRSDFDHGHEPLGRVDSPDRLSRGRGRDRSRSRSRAPSHSQSRSHARPSHASHNPVAYSPAGQKVPYAHGAIYDDQHPEHQPKRPLPDSRNPSAEYQKPGDSSRAPPGPAHAPLPGPTHAPSGPPPHAPYPDPYMHQGQYQPPPPQQHQHQMPYQYGPPPPAGYGPPPHQPPHVPYYQQPMWSYPQPMMPPVAMPLPLAPGVHVDHYYDISDLRSTARTGLNEYMNLMTKAKRSEKARFDMGVMQQINQSKMVVLTHLDTLEKHLNNVLRSSEKCRWRSWIAGLVAGSIVPLIKSLFRRIARHYPGLDAANDTEYAFKRSRTLTDYLKSTGLGRKSLAGVAMFIFAVLYVFQNEVLLRVSRTMLRRLAKLRLKLCNGKNVNSDDVEVMDGWRWRVISMTA